MSTSLDILLSSISDPSFRWRLPKLCSPLFIWKEDTTERDIAEYIGDRVLYGLVYLVLKRRHPEVSLEVRMVGSTKVVLPKYIRF